MKHIFGSHYFLHLFTNSTSQHLRLTTLSLCECKLILSSVLWRAYGGRIYSTREQNLKLDSQYSSNKGRLVNQICLSKHKYLLVQKHES